MEDFFLKTPLIDALAKKHKRANDLKNIFDDIKLRIEKNEKKLKKFYTSNVIDYCNKYWRDLAETIDQKQKSIDFIKYVQLDIDHWLMVEGYEKGYDECIENAKKFLLMQQLVLNHYIDIYNARIKAFSDYANFQEGQLLFFKRHK